MRPTINICPWHILTYFAIFLGFVLSFFIWPCCPHCHRSFLVSKSGSWVRRLQSASLQRLGQRQLLPWWDRRPCHRCRAVDFTACCCSGDVVNGGKMLWNVVGNRTGCMLTPCRVASLLICYNLFMLKFGRILSLSHQSSIQAKLTCEYKQHCNFREAGKLPLHLHFLTIFLDMRDHVGHCNWDGHLMMLAFNMHFICV